MATLRDIKKRIFSVKSTQKITKAMKMVAAAKLRRAQSAVVGSRPYSKKLEEIVLDIVSKSSERDANKLFVGHETVQKAELLVYSSNRGLCGGFNSNLLRKSERFVRELKLKKVSTNLCMIGKKGREFFTVRKYELAKLHPEWADRFSFDDAIAVTKDAVDRFNAGEIQEFYLSYNRFKSAISQEPTIEKLLPLSLPVAESSYGVDYIYEPGKIELLNDLLPKYLATKVYKAHLESVASELGSRMSAMDSATKNASEMIGALTLKYNRARQASITKELMDIVNGAEAIK